MPVESAIKVHESTKEKVRAAAAMADLKQSEFIERAVDEYIKNHRHELAERMERALQLGPQDAPG